MAKYHYIDTKNLTKFFCGRKVIDLPFNDVNDDGCMACLYKMDAEDLQ